MIYYWLLSVFIGGLLFYGYPPTQQFAEKIEANNCQREANYFLDQVAVLQQHEHLRTTGEPGIHFTQRGETYFVWVADTPGLAGCLMVESAHSRLILRLYHGQLSDLEGAAVTLTLPSGIPDNSLIYYYQE